EVEPAVAVDVRERDPARDLRLAEADLAREVVVAPVAGAHKERIRRVPGEIVPGEELVPARGIPQELVVPHRDLVQLRTAVDGPLQEAQRLDRRGNAVVVEVREPRVPGPAAAGKSELLARFDVGGYALRHRGDLARRDPGELALLEAVLGRDVADVDV